VNTAERTISSLLDFARAKPPLKRKVNIEDIIRESLSRLKVPDNIHVKFRADKLVPAIMVDPDQLGQVFGNVLLNAIQAMPEGGQLKIKCETAAADTLAVTVSDTGVGISSENIKRVFEPLFTGKAKGIGLGMAITKTFIEGHGGSIEVKSEVGQGSTFTVTLPILKKGDKEYGK